MCFFSHLLTSPAKPAPLRQNRLTPAGTAAPRSQPLRALVIEFFRSEPVSGFSAPSHWHLQTALSTPLLRPEGAFSKASMTTSHSCLRPSHGCPRPWHRGLAFRASVGSWPGCDRPLPHAFPLTFPQLHPHRTHNPLKRLCSVTCPWSILFPPLAMPFPSFPVWLIAP